MSIDSTGTEQRPSQSPGALRPTIEGTRHMVAAGHYLAAQAGLQVLEAGGNAVDAGVAAGLALGVVQSDFVNIAGVAPTMIYLSETQRVVTIDGLGTWPAAVSLERFAAEHNGAIPHGLARTVVPAAPAAWITALEQFGTMSFADAASAAIRFAREGFPMHPLMAEIIAAYEEAYNRWPSSAAVYLPGGRPPAVGDRFVQADLAATLQHMADEERAAGGGGRAAGLQAARDAFYKGDVARTIASFHAENGGYLSYDDLAGYRCRLEPPVSAELAGTTVYCCGPWCQGPVLAQMMRLLEPFDLASLGHNSGAYVHLLVEAMKLAFADREAFYGDPRFVEVPLDALLSRTYADQRRRSIQDDRAIEGVAMPGLPSGHASASDRPDAHFTSAALDTSYVCVIDRDGNAFSATPSDVSVDTPVIPGTGLCPSSRGSQSWTTPGHPAVLAPGKRPRLTPNPALAIGADGRLIPFGTPGGDVQCQAMLQALLNRLVFGMACQDAVEAPRFATYCFPDSFEPHAVGGDLTIESRADSGLIDRLTSKGHKVRNWPDWTWKAGGVCLLDRNPYSGVISAGADPRRPSYAVGW